MEDVEVPRKESLDIGLWEENDEKMEVKRRERKM